MTSYATIRLMKDSVEDEKGRQRYVPAVLTVRNISQYNADQVSFDGVDDFWQISDAIKEKMGIPPPGTVALFTLTTKPKSGPKAKPGSMYRDVVAVAKVPAGYVAPEAAEYEPETPVSNGHAPTGPQPVYRPPQDSRERSIERQVAYKGLTEVIAALISHPSLLPEDIRVEIPYLYSQWVLRDIALWTGAEPPQMPRVAFVTPDDDNAFPGGRSDPPANVEEIPWETEAEKADRDAADVEALGQAAVEALGQAMLGVDAGPIKGRRQH